MKYKITAFFCGALFALGLGISQMTRPPKILGFLNVFGDWDPTLLVVFAAATGVYLIGYHWLIGNEIKDPLESYLRPKEKLSMSVIIGAVIFGTGWGLIGLCHGPALTDLLSFKPAILLFLGGMAAGMYGARYTQRFIK